jgi:carboxyl-terminal processing protease
MTRTKPIPILATLAIATACGVPGGVHARFGYSEQGLRVVDVDPDGPAASAGLRRDDRIVAIDGDEVSALSGEDIVEKLRGNVGAPVRLEVARAGEILEIVVVRAPYRPR